MAAPSDRGNAAEPLSVLDELRRREPIFHRPEYAATRADFARMMVDDYWEVGASGRRYDRAVVLDVLESCAPDPGEHDWRTSDFHCRELGLDTFLLTYVLDQNGRISRRSTIWRRAMGDWQILYHQGTLVAP